MLPNFLQALGWAVLNSMWQMALLWVIYQLVTALNRNILSSQKSFLATALLFTGMAWFLYTFFLLLADIESLHSGYPELLAVDGNSTVNSLLQTILPAASGLYLILLIFPLLNFVRNLRYVSDIRHSGITKSNVKWRMFVQKLAPHMGITRPVYVWMSNLVNSPVTIGFFKPIILLPVAAINHLTVQQIEAILLHELSHIRRFDFLLNLITRVIQTILYFNPFVNAFAKIIEREREKSCDELVLQFQYEPHGYASALLALEKAAHKKQTLAVAASGAKQKDLLARIESIMGVRRKSNFSFHKLAGVLAALLCFITLNALLLLSKPGNGNDGPGLFTDIAGPFHLFSPGFEIKKADPQMMPANPIASISTKASALAENDGEFSINYPLDPPQKPDQHTDEIAFEQLQDQKFVHVNLVEPVVPELDDQQKEQVKEALDASKIVMTEDQWKVIEKGIADAMTAKEKAKFKEEYKKAIQEVDWKAIENNLRIAYDEINWNQINSQLNNALVEIKLDSLHHAYNSAITNLCNIEKELVRTGQCGIPDSDITLKSLEQQKMEVQDAIKKLKVVRSRKIVHL